MDIDKWLKRHELPTTLPFIHGAELFDDGSGEGEFYFRFDSLGTKVLIENKEELVVEWLRLTEKLFCV